jgi:hypothetical protein
VAKRQAVKAVVAVVALALGAWQQGAQGSAGSTTPVGEPALPPSAFAPPAFAQDGAGDLDLVMSSRITTAPSYVTSVVRPRPNPGNRLLRVTIDAPGFARTSAVALDGDDAPRNCHFYWRNLQPGLYNLVATVHDATGAVLAHRRLTFAVVSAATAE